MSISKKVFQELYNLGKNVPKINLSNDRIVNYKKQISGRDINKNICEYQYFDHSIINQINYKRIKNYWNTYTLEVKTDIFLNTIESLNTKYKEKMIAYTIYSQNKTYNEAYKDSIIDLTNNIHYYLLKMNDIYNNDRLLNYNIKHNPLNGFIGVCSSYNSNTNSNLLCLLPLLFGNTVLWNPHPNSILTNYLFYEILLENGLPRGLLNFIPMERQSFLEMIINNKNLGGLMYDYQTDYYKYYNIDYINKNNRNNLYNYNPKIISKSRGNNFHFIDESYCDNKSYFKKMITDTFNSAFSFSGQNPNSCCRIYLPFEYFNDFKDIMNNLINNININEYSIINKEHYLKYSLVLKNYNNNLLIGGYNLNTNNYHIQPTLLITNNYNCDLLKHNFQAPILTLYLYNSSKIEKTMIKCNHITKNCSTSSLYTNDTVIENLGKKIFTNVEDNLFINKPCNINIYNTKILNQLYNSLHYI